MTASNITAPHETPVPARAPFEARPLTSSKIHNHHHDRLAVVYVRQSTPRQVLEHRESTLLQYQLTERAEFYGWRKDRILVIDDDLGQSGRSAEGRMGFQRLLAEVSLDHVGLVLGIEMSRLARSCKDWHQLLELCALFRCLLADQDGLYDPADYNDRLLLGLKGTMSEAELHILKGRMQQGSLNKARRGELITIVPFGYVQAPDGEVVLDPDDEARSIVQLVFEKFEDLGSAMAVLRYLLRHNIHLPIRAHSGTTKGQIDWREPRYSTLTSTLKNPTYTGAYTYGRFQRDPRRAVAGQPQSGRFLARQEDWKILIPGKFPAYISWDQYVANVKQLMSNRSLFDSPGVPREGPALLSGILFCGRCGRRMSPHYKGGTKPAAYFCMGAYPAQGTRTCQRLCSRFVDDLVAQQVLRAIEPATLELSLDASDRIRRERQELHTQWKLKLERAKFQSDRARRQYDAVEPENRLVARELERRWEATIVDQRQLQEEYDRYERDLPQELSSEEIAFIRSLSSDIPSLWNADTTSRGDRQTIVRHLIERVVVAIQGRSEYFDVSIHWQGGFVSQHAVRRAVAKYDQLQDFDRLRSTVQALWRSGKTTTEIALSLNGDGLRSPQGKPFTRHIVRKLLDTWGLTAPQRAQVSGELVALATDEWWLLDLSRKLSIDSTTLARWCRRGWVNARKLPGRCKWWIVWADDEECSRLHRLYSHGRGFPHHNGSPYPAELKMPNRKPPTKPQRAQ